MGEFVGLNPHGVRLLITALGETAQRAAALKPYLSASITQAGVDWPAGPATEVLDRCLQFLTAAHADLSWRAQTIERIENASSKDGVKGAEFPFPSAASAHAAGIIAGDLVKAAWAAYQADPTVTNRRELLSALADRQGKASDPEYAAGLLNQLGASAFAGILRAASLNDQNNRIGYDPTDLARVRKQLGPLAEAFAAADPTGAAPADLRTRLLDKTPLSDLAVLLALAPQSTSFIVAAGTKLAKASGSKSPDLNWNTHWLVKSLTHDIAATQQLLADPDTAELLLRPATVKGTATPGFEKMLADALNKALAPEAGDDTLRRTAWINTIKALGDPAAWSSLTPSTDQRTGMPTPSPISPVLAEHIRQYLPDFARIWMASDPENEAVKPAAWKDLSASEITMFLGSLSRDPAALSVLEKNYTAFVGKVDLGEGHPFGDAATEGERQKQRNVFFGRASVAAAVASLLIGGLHKADLSEEEARDTQIQLMLFPLDLAVGAFSGGVGGHLVLETAIGKAADLYVKNPGQDLLSELWDGAPPEEATRLTNALVNRQMAAFVASRQQHGLSPLSKSDVKYTKNTFRGLLLPVVLEALKERGG
ncbi:hypothetical protein GCM10022226_63980 [Sphaerisporangium flaviroseum]|uniref:Uncharacterized protein n=1 Tax=Sphaerisporangium flaviroseum TaxID=509199 RepID=A0ABP7J3R5_9ACTN